ncbi:hypothetical protein O0L34_g17821 [Tuta absoluta]|nr:hypothetical protein O0L34_g17821 [Tuta absoluta]
MEIPKISAAKASAERQKKYRARLKAENPEKFERIKAKTAARAREYYRNKQKNLTEVQKQEERQLRLQRDIQQFQIQKNCVNNQENTLPQPKPCQRPENDVNGQENISQQPEPCQRSENDVNNEDGIRQPRNALVRNRIDIKNLERRLNRRQKIQIQQIQAEVNKILIGFDTLQRRYRRQQEKLKELNEKCEILETKLSSTKVPNLVPSTETESIDSNAITPLKRTEQFIANYLQDIITPQKQVVKKKLLEHNVLKE